MNSTMTRWYSIVCQSKAVLCEWHRDEIVPYLCCLSGQDGAISLMFVGAKQFYVSNAKTRWCHISFVCQGKDVLCE